ncbi:hypothetical protein O7608_23410 [Solwaraspora sp. WMMA2056]|uniref:hypothetical protein n=1 Tax=Solwaraspora sp. WMMA2056 TaxID=3015161 RepID=UPI00259BB01D|nr:hypothetical protein [Solwaraspora sp. WMMA2056]WJK44074.1 hypothetical protein O7608_23410 [Solwaraspora sp. WMMA2056]
MTDPTRSALAVPTAGRRRAGRLAASFAGLMLGAAVLAGCSSEGASTDCGLDACTVTFDRGVEASASFLGIEAKLIGAEGDRVTVEVAGEQVTLTTGQQATEVGGMAVTLEQVTDSQVVVRVARQ